MKVGYWNRTIDSKEIKFDKKKYNIPERTFWYCYVLTPQEALVEA